MIAAILASALLAGGAPETCDPKLDVDCDTHPVLGLDDVTYKLKPPRRTLYPYSSLMRGLEGQATIICYIRKNGTVGDCSIVKETPDNAQFGNATSALFANYLTVAPQTKTGEPTAGRRIRLTQAWQIPSGHFPHGPVEKF